ncbi:MAG: thermostable hemolysin delta-VPH [Clostridia bacterium]
MTWFSYHGKAKKLIASGKLTDIKFYDIWNKISPAMVLFFENEKPMPIREYRWNEYFILLKSNEIFKKLMENTLKKE